MSSSFPETLPEGSTKLKYKTVACGGAGDGGGDTLNYRDRSCQCQLKLEASC